MNRDGYQMMAPGLMASGRTKPPSCTMTHHSTQAKAKQGEAKKGRKGHHSPPPPGSSDDEDGEEGGGEGGYNQEGGEGMSDHDYTRGQRFKKLFKLLASTLIQQPTLRYKKHATAIILGLAAVHLGLFMWVVCLHARACLCACMSVASRGLSMLKPLLVYGSCSSWQPGLTPLLLTPLNAPCAA